MNRYKQNIFLNTGHKCIKILFKKKLHKENTQLTRALTFLFTKLQNTDNILYDAFVADTQRLSPAERKEENTKYKFKSLLDKKNQEE